MMEKGEGRYKRKIYKKKKEKEKEKEKRNLEITLENMALNKLFMTKTKNYPPIYKNNLAKVFIIITKQHKMFLLIFAMIRLGIAQEIVLICGDLGERLNQKDHSPIVGIKYLVGI